MCARVLGGDFSIFEVETRKARRNKQAKTYKLLYVTSCLAAASKDEEEEGEEL